MSICYVNGKFVAKDDAKVSIFDRGYLFSDGIYEVSMVLNSKLVDNLGHLERLKLSLAKLDMKMPMPIDEIIKIQNQLIEKNNIKTGSIYLQVTRGVDDERDFSYSENIKPSLIMIAQNKDLLNNLLADKGISVMTLPEIRWAKRDVKAISLLGAVLAKKTAKDNGFNDAWFVENGFVTEGSSNNVFIIINNEIITKKANSQILKGITRQAVMQIAQQKNMQVIERDFTVDEAKQADEVFVTSATMLIIPVIKVDETVVSNGKPGEITNNIRQIYIDMAKSGKFS